MSTSTSIQDDAFGIHSMTTNKTKVPDDMVSMPPIPCDFKVGDEVVFTNDYGVQFHLSVRGFAEVPHYHPGGEYDPDPRFVYIFKDAWWFPVKASSIRLALETDSSSHAWWFSKKTPGKKFERVRDSQSY